MIGIYSEKRAETSHGKDPGGRRFRRRFRGQSQAWRADLGREGAWNRGLGVLVDGDVGFTGAHGVEDIPPTRRSGVLVWCGRVAEQRRKKLVGCLFRGTAHQLLIGADSHHEQRP